MTQAPIDTTDGCPGSTADTDAFGCAPAVPAYDVHNHTVHCGHADEDATVINLIARASQLGLSHIGISEHVMQPADIAHIDQIREEMRSLVSMGAQPILGVEMDVNPADPEGNWILPEINCDYVILSPHGFPQFDMEIPESDRLLPQELQRKRLAACWMRWYRKAVERGRCQILGHPLREPIAMNLIDLSDPELMDMAVDTIAPAIDHGIAFELNNAFITALLPSVHYAGYLELLTRLRSLGIRFSRGSDSHGLLRVGSSDGIVQVAQRLNLTEADWLDIAELTGR